jgi:hypothetical protein
MVKYSRSNFMTPIPAAASVDEASVYRLLKAPDLINSPAFIVMKAANEFKDKTTAPNQLWQTDFTESWLDHVKGNRMQPLQGEGAILREARADRVRSDICRCSFSTRAAYRCSISSSCTRGISKDAADSCGWVPQSSEPKPDGYRLSAGRATLSVVMGGNALDVFGHQFHRRRLTEVAHAEDADHPHILVDHRQPADF